jgi:predicted GNAT superfamily acetyltransferase
MMLKGSRLPIPKRWKIRPLMDGDRAALLRLNGGNSPEVWPLREADLTALLAYEGTHLVAVDADENVLGYLLSFPRASGYADAEIQEFRRLISEPFFYICQVVIASEHRRHGIGRALYDALTDLAQRTGVRVLGCDVNTDPPNPVSLAFHQRLGFVQIAEGHASNGFAIALLAKRW